MSSERMTNRPERSAFKADEGLFEESAWDTGTGMHLYEYMLLIRPWRFWIIGSTIMAVLLTFYITRFLMTQWYQGHVTLRPASQEGPSFSGGILGASGLGDLASSVGTSLGLGSAPWDAQEDSAILTSYDFDLAIIDQLNLAERILPPRVTPDMRLFERLRVHIRSLKLKLGLNPYSRWNLYLVFQDLLDVEFDDKAGNMDVYFLDPNPEMAVKVTRALIDSLRRKLRLRAIDYARKAISSLQDQVAHTSDALLITQLDQLMAQQLQQQVTAEVQSDFAFVVIQAPYAPGQISQPWMLIDCIIVGILTPCFFILGLISEDRIIKPYRHAMDTLVQENDLPVEPPAEKPVLARRL